MRLGWWLPRWAALSRAPDAGAVALYRWAGAFSTLHGVVFAILSPGSAVQRPQRPGHETVNASRLATRRFNSKPSCSSTDRGTVFPVADRRREGRRKQFPSRRILGLARPPPFFTDAVVGFRHQCSL